MSLERRIYIGPYLKCSPAKTVPVEPFGLRDLIGCNDNPGFDALGPNDEVEWLHRTLFYDRNAESEVVVDIDSIQVEMALFEAKLDHQIRENRGDYDRVEVCWGIIEGLY